VCGKLGGFRLASCAARQAAAGTLHKTIYKLVASVEVSRREFSALYAWNRTWRALHCQSLKHKLKSAIWICV